MGQITSRDKLGLINKRKKIKKSKKKSFVLYYSNERQKIIS
jgi:hypothetical protein